MEKTSQLNRKYKAVIFDLDGTAIPNQKDGRPSPRLVSAVEQAKQSTFICAATGRPWSNCFEVIRALGLISPCIISGGTQIIDPATKKILWQHPLDQEQVRSIIKVMKQYSYKLYLSDDLVRHSPANIRDVHAENIIYISNIHPHSVPNVLQSLLSIPNIVAHGAPSWKPGYIELHVTHIEATKENALHILIEILGLKREEIIGVGDGDNDLPLFAAVGYKVAVGNASDSLKAAADLIAPSESEDGLAQVIEQLLLT